ncbi:MAG: hypothetical protein V3V03_02970 [Hyphomonadaceae bacterium]
MFRSIFAKGIASALILSLAAPAALGFGIGLQPTTVEMEMEPGDRQRQVINIANVHQEKTISLTLGLADWALDENGQIELTPPGETPASSADWVRFSPAFVTLKPGQAQQIIVDIAAPVRLEQSGDHRFALLASTVLPEERAGGSGVWKKYQIASLFYLTTGDAVSTPEITSSGLTVTPEGQTMIGLRIENEGNAHARLEGSIRITSDDAEPQSITIANLVVLDQGARNYHVPLAGPLPENSEIEVRLENIFAPQAADQREPLPIYSVATPTQQASLEPTQ